MASRSLVIKRNDTKPVKFQLLDKNGAVNLTGATIKFIVAKPNGDVVIESSSVTINDAVKGKVQYEPTAAEVAETLRGNGEFEVTDSAGDVQSYPSGSYIDVEIIKDLA